MEDKWKELLESKEEVTAEQFAELQANAAVELKKHDENTSIGELKARVDTFRDSTIQAIRKHGQPRRTTTIFAQKMSSETSLLVAELTKHVRCGIVSWGLAWSLKPDLLDEVPGRVVAYPAARIKYVAPELRAMEYYDKKKQRMKKVREQYKVCSASVAITTSAPARKVKSLIAKIDKHAQAIEQATGGAGKALAPQFYQTERGASRVLLSTDYNLIEARILLEGSEHIFGVPLTHIPGFNLAEKRESLNKMDGATWLALATQYGFGVALQIGSCVFIPPDFAIVGIGGDEQHGLRWLFAGSQAKVEAAKNWAVNYNKDFPIVPSEAEVHDQVIEAVEKSIKA